MDIIALILIVLALIISGRILNTTLPFPKIGVLALSSFNGAFFAIWTAFWIFAWSKGESSNLHGMSLKEIMELYRYIGLPSIIFGFLQGSYQFSGFYLWRNKKRIITRIVSGGIIVSSIILFFTGLGLILIILGMLATQ